MNIKANLIKTFIGLSVATALTACTSAPVQPPQEVVITPPFIIDEVRDNVATIYTEDDQYTIKVTFDARTFKDGNGFERWNDVEIREISDIQVFDDVGSVNYYMNSLDVIDLKDQIEVFQRDHL